jgi:hypothetical protein
MRRTTLVNVARMGLFAATAYMVYRRMQGQHERERQAAQREA